MGKTVVLSTVAWNGGVERVGESSGAGGTVLIALSIDAKEMFSDRMHDNAESDALQPSVETTWFQ